MTCPEARDLFSARADEALAPDERAALEAHLATCGECRREWQRLAATVGLLRAVEPARAPAGFVDRVVAAARPQPWYRRLARTVFLPWPVKLPLEAAAIVLVGGLAVLVVQRSPELHQTAQAPAPAIETRPHALPSPAPDAAGTSTPDAGARLRAQAREELTANFEKRATPDTPPADSRDTAPRAVVDDAHPESAPPRVSQPAPEELLARRAQPAERYPFTAKAAPAPSGAATASGDLAPAGRAKREEPARKELERDATSGVIPGGASARRRADTLSETSVRVPAAVELRLAVADRAAAEREITGVVERLGGALVADPATSTLEIMVPPQAFPSLTGELARLGTLRIVRQPTELPATVRVSVQLTD